MAMSMLAKTRAARTANKAMRSVSQLHMLSTTFLSAIRADSAIHCD